MPVIVVKNNNIHILTTVFNMTSYNFVCEFIMIVGISLVILVAMVSILTIKYGLCSYQHTYIYKMEKCHLLSLSTVIVYMSTEPSVHQHSQTAVTFLNIWSVD